MPTDDRTAAEIERDLERERSQLGDTIESLGERMSVEHITAEISNQLKSVGSDAFRDAADRIADNARTNPAAVALAGAGLLWLMLGQKGEAGKRRMPPPTFPSERVRRARTIEPADIAQASPPAQPVSVTDRAAQVGKDALHSLRGGVEDLRARLAEGTEGLTEEGRARVIAAREAAVEAAESAVEGVRNTGRSAMQSVEENPWVYGGVALALGAAIGGALLYRKTEEDAREHRNEMFAEADRIWRKEAERARLDRNQSVAGQPPPHGVK